MSSKIAADMPGSLKTEAVVLRSIRYGEADRILHLYTPDLGRIGAIAKGVRRARSRFGWRLEPFSRVALVLHQGRSDLMTVTGADTIASNAHLREHGRAPLHDHGYEDNGAGQQHKSIQHLVSPLTVSWRPAWDP